MTHKKAKGLKSIPLLMRNLFSEEMIPGNKTINSSNFSYQACLIPSRSEDLQHQVRDISNYIVVPLDMLLAVMSFVCNTLVFITITRTKSLRHPSLLMLCSLSITDLIWVLLTLMINIFVLLDPHMCPEIAHEEASITILCFLATLSNLAMISGDRYLAMSKPAWYRSHLSRSHARVVKTTLFTWLSSMLTTLIVYTVLKTGISHDELVIFTVVFLFYVVCILMILHNYVRLFIANRKHFRSLRVRVEMMRAREEREKTMTRIVSVILLCFLFSFLPAVISPLILVALGLPLRPFEPFISLLFTINGLLNPLLNYGRSKDIRREIVSTLRCRHRRVGQQLPAVRYNRNAKKENISVIFRERNLHELHIGDNKKTAH